MSMSLKRSVIARLYAGFFKEFDLNVKDRFFTEFRNATRCNMSINRKYDKIILLNKDLHI